jgi:hypothetical protein
MSNINFCLGQRMSNKKFVKASYLGRWGGREGSGEACAVPTEISQGVARELTAGVPLPGSGDAEVLDQGVRRPGASTTGVSSDLPETIYGGLRYLQ